jgi:SAM-dependent methyltransferase
MRLLDLGCGPNKNNGFIGIDHYAFDGVDIVRDLARGLPFEDNVIEGVLIKHCLEHFDDTDFLFIVEEMGRVCRPGAQITVILPDATSPNIRRDPTHKKRDWDDYAFDFWKIGDDGEYVIFRGPEYGTHAKLHLARTEIDSNLDRIYILEVL